MTDNKHVYDFLQEDKETREFAEKLQMEKRAWEECLESDNDDVFLYAYNELEKLHKKVGDMLETIKYRADRLGL